MLSFWALAALLTCIATASVVWPLLRKRTATADRSDEDARRLAVYRDRRREIEQERAALRLTPEEADRALDELVAEAAAQFPDAGAGLRAGAPAGPAMRPAMGWAAAAAIVLPLVALVVYDRIGAPGLVVFGGAAPRAEVSAERVDKAISELEARVRAKPDDAEGWAMLGQAKRFRDDAAGAAQAYGKAVALVPRDAGLLADYAEALALLHDGNFAGKPMDLLGQAMAIAPKDGKVLSLMAAAQYRSGNLPETLRHLRALLEVVPPGSGEDAPIREAIEKVERELGPSASARAPAQPSAAGRPAGPPKASTTAAVSGSVEIDAALRDKVPAGATLFIVARDPDGPRTPLAVRRVPATGWPVRFELSDADAMDPSRPISAARRVALEARISASGNAMRQPGDLIGAGNPVLPGARDVAIRIDRQVP